MKGAALGSSPIESGLASFSVSDTVTSFAEAGRRAAVRHKPNPRQELRITLMGFSKPGIASPDPVTVLGNCRMEASRHEQCPHSTPPNPLPWAAHKGHLPRSIAIGFLPLPSGSENSNDGQVQETS